MDPGNKIIWKNKYIEEYNRLQDLPTWALISETECHNIRHIVRKDLPVMEISTITYDEKGFPKQAKWCIVALRNFDPHNWSTKYVIAPVLYILDFRFLVSLAIQHKVPLTNGDIEEEFVQATLPP